MRKEGGWQWYHSIGLALSYSRCDFQTNQCKPHPVRGIKQLSEPYLYNLQTIIVSPHRKKNCLRYLTCIFFGSWGGGGWGQHSLVVCCNCIASFFSVWRIFKAASPMIANDAKVTTAMLPISVKYPCTLFEKIYDEADYYRHLKYWGGCTIPLCQLCVWCEKCVAARHYAVIWKQLLFANKRNRVLWVVLGLHRFQRG